MTVLAGIALANGLATLIPMLLADAIKFKQLLTPLGPNVTVNIMTLDGVALKEDELVLAEVNLWRESKGLAPLTSTAAISG